MAILKLSISTAAKYDVKQTFFTGPGTFSIKPLPRQMYSPVNYNVTYVNGALYVKVKSASNGNWIPPNLQTEFNEEIIMNSYPNPVSDIFYINMNNSLISKVELSIVEYHGKMHDARPTRNLAGNRLELDMTGMKTGLYLLKLNFENDQKIIKIVKQ